jgi:hypothetical protein
LGFTLTREIARTGVAGAVMGVGILLGLNWPLPVVVAVAVFLYVGTLVLVQGVTSADVRMLREIVFSRLRVE